MKISLEWLKEYCEWTWSTEELCNKLTMSGTEVEAVHQKGIPTDLVVTAQVLKKAQHPNADRLSLCQVTDGTTTRQIVCGATNFKENDIVPLALPGAVLGPDFVIKESKLRGELSQGMMCSARELGMGSDHAGLLILPQDTPLGVPLTKMYPSETVVEVEVTPNRADLLSYLGIAREFCTLGAKSKQNPTSHLYEETNSSPWTLHVQSGEDCPRYTAIELTNVKVGPSPEWLKRRLEAIGLRSINNVVDITNYVLFETGQPLHTFDADLIESQQIHVRKANKGEKIIALDDKEYTLNENDLIIADAKRPIAIAGVMGGKESGITEKTTRILLESAQFKGTTVRTTSRRLTLMSDSSYRFERGTDPATVDLARNRAITLLMELAGAKVAGGYIESQPISIQSKPVKLRLDRASHILGYEVTAQRVEQILSGLGISKSGENEFTPPSFRPDIAREVDLIEEIARIGGLEKTPSRFQLRFNKQTETDLIYLRRNELREFLAHQGFFEVMSNSIAKRYLVPEAVQLINPMNEDYATMRYDLLTGALSSLQHNLAREQRDLRLFEMGTVYRQEKGRSIESNHLVLLMTGNERPTQWTEKERNTDYFTLKGILDTLLQEFPECEAPKEFGALPKKLLAEYGIKVPVFAVELTVSSKVKKKVAKYQPLAQYPSMSRDLAVVVDRSVPQEQVLSTIQRLNIKELEAITCFDLFQDDQGTKLANDKKSLAYNLTFRSSEGTLKEDQVNQFQQKILSELKTHVGADLR